MGVRIPHILALHGAAQGLAGDEGRETEGRHEAMDDLEMQARAELVYRRAQRELGEAQVALKLLADLQKANPSDAVFEAAAGSAARVKGLLYKRVKDLEVVVFGRTA